MADRLPEGVARKLAGLRSSVRRWLLLDGAAWTVALLTSLIFVSLLADWSLRMDRPQRGVSLLLGLLGLGLLAYRRLGRPLRTPLGDDELCLRVEAGHRSLGESLISAVQFARSAPLAGVGYSEQLVEAAIRQGAERSAALDFGSVLHRSRRNRSVLLGGSLLALLVAACLLMPQVMGLWFRRNVLLGNDNWPQDTRLAVAGLRDGALYLPRGDDLELMVEADPSGVLPEAVQIEYQLQDSGAKGSDPMVMVGGNSFRWVFKNLQEPLRFRASGGDALTEYFEVRLVARPALESVSLRLTQPSYTGKPVKALGLGEGAYYVLKGSRLEIVGTANKALERAELFQGKDLVGPLSLKDPRSVLTVLDLKQVGTCSYRIVLRDTDGLLSRKDTRFTIKTVPDRKPTLRARLVGIGDLITGRATIPVFGKFSDDFSITYAGLSFRMEGGPGALGEGQEQKTEPARGEGDQETGKKGGERHQWAGRSVPFEGLKYGVPELEHTYRFEAEPLKLAPGTHLSLCLEAKDNDTISGPNLGQSNLFSLKVVTEDELRAELLRREQEQRQEFERLIKEQKELLEAVVRFQDSIKTQAQEIEKLWRGLKGTEKRQRLAGGRCETIAEHYEQILAEVENNKLEENLAPVHKRLKQGIIQPLRALATGLVVQAANALDQASTASQAGEARAQALREAAARQQEILAAMDGILRNMVKWEGYQEAVNLALEILKSQRQVNEATLKAQQEKIRKIFDD